MKKSLLCAATLTLIFFLQLAPTAGAVETDGRFSMTPTDDGFLRLDSQTGAVALCGRSDGDWICNPVADSQLASQSKLAALKKENSDLKAEIEDLQRALNAQLTDGKPSDGTNPGFNVPSEQDVDKLMGFLENLARRFKGMVKELKENNEPGRPL